MYIYLSRSILSFTIKSLPMAHDTRLAVPAYRQIKEYVLTQIAQGTWRTGDLIPSEHEFVKQFDVSRMTVNRALRELTTEHVLIRTQGVGTFVTAQRYQSTLIEIKSISKEIIERGNAHTSNVLKLARTTDAKALALLGRQADSYAFHSRIVHFENGMPIQLEDRYVNPELYPTYLEQDFRTITPNEYMTREAPAQKVEYQVTARMPDVRTRRLLLMNVGEPCLVLHRRTWARNMLATEVNLWHPGSRFQFTGHF